MMKTAIAALLLSLSQPALAQNPWDLGKKAVGGAAVGKLQGELNRRLLEEGRKNQCSFKSGTDVLEKGCDPKSQRLANVLVDAKAKLAQAGVENFKFVVSGHTDTTGSAEKNKELSKKRAEVMVRQLVKKGVAPGDIIAVGMGPEKPLVTPDDTPAKKAKNRRYEVQIQL
jgi:outer membrane protein OmpA-like peptidoglycan-associated protein